MSRNKYIVSGAEKVALTSIPGLGGYPHGTIYNLPILKAIARELQIGAYNEPDGELALMRGFPTMLVCCGYNLTCYTRAVKKGRAVTEADVIKHFEAWMQGFLDSRIVASSLDLEEAREVATTELFEQLLQNASSVAYNSSRSSGCNLKSIKQKGDIKQVFAKLQDPRLSIVLGEIPGRGFDPKPDGYIPGKLRKHRKQSDIIAYNRYGDSNGGAQRDRANQIKGAPAKYKSHDFLIIWDGVESDQETIDLLNKDHSVAKSNATTGAVYATTLKDFDEAKLLELFDR